MITVRDGTLYQWDTGRVIEVIHGNKAVNKIDIYNGTTEYALVLETWEENNRTCAKIPDIFLQTTNTISVYAVLVDGDDQRTVKSARISICSREKPEDYVYTPEEILRYEKLENLISGISNEVSKLSEEKADILRPFYQAESAREWISAGFVFGSLNTGMLVGKTYMIIIKTDRKNAKVTVRGAIDGTYNHNDEIIECNDSNGVYYYYTTHTPIEGETRLYVTPNYNEEYTTSQLFIYETIMDEEVVKHLMGKNGTLNDAVANLGSHSATSYFSYESNHSLETDFANKAEKADQAIYAQNYHDLIGDVTVDDFDMFGGTIDSVTENIVTCTSITTYGAPCYFHNMLANKRYMVIWQGERFDSCGLMKGSGTGWNNVAVSTVKIDEVEYHYAVIIPLEDDIPNRIYWNNINNKTTTFTVISVTPISDIVDVNSNYVASCIHNKKFNIAVELEKNQKGQWSGKKVLFMGDSLTAANKYQNTVASILGVEYTNHCLGGAGIIQIIDGNSAGTITAITSEKVADKDLIVFYAGYNNRGTNEGELGDCYNPDGTGQNTIAGYMQYAINRIYECLTEADNLTCKLLIVTVDCAGKYNYIDADGYDEYPAESGRTMETLANIQKAVAEYNSLACCDLWHTSGINRNTWSVFGANSEAYIENPTNTSTPYPHNGDQLHKSTKGYQRIGEVIAGAIIKAYGR